MLKACKNCHLIVEFEKKCPKCGGELSESFSGQVIILDPERSQVAKVMGINSVGAYAIKVK